MIEIFLRFSLNIKRFITQQYYAEFINCQVFFGVDVLLSKRRIEIRFLELILYLTIGAEISIR